MTEKQRVEKLEKNVEQLIARQELIVQKLDTIAEMFRKMQHPSLPTCPECESMMNSVSGIFPRSAPGWECPRCGTNILLS